MRNFLGLKGAKASDQDNYRGFTLLPILRKIYEMVLLCRLEKHAADEGFCHFMAPGPMALWLWPYGPGPTVL